MSWKALAACAAVLLASTRIAFGQEASSEEAVVVSATRAPQPELDIPASVDRLYPSEIREGEPRVNLSESLIRVPGIEVQNRQNYAQDLQISSRGFGARSTFGVRGIRLIADGIPATMPDGQGQASTIALDSAARIEVLRGPFSALYGNASGGVIIVETQDGPPTPSVDADFWAGNYGAWRAGIKFGGQWGALNGIGDVSRFATDGFREHSAAQRDHLNAKLKYALQPDTGLTIVVNSLRQPETQDPLGLTREQLDENRRQAGSGAQLFDTRKTVNQDQAGITLAHRLEGGSRVELTAYGGRRFVEQYLAFQGTGPTSSGGVVRIDRTYGGGALRYFTQLGAVGLSAGLEYGTMDDHRKGFVNDFGVAGDLKRDEDDYVANGALYAQAEWKLAQRWIVHAGVRRSRVGFDSRDAFITATNPDDSGRVTYDATTPVAGVVYKAGRRTSVYASYGRGFETPTFTELAYRSTGTGLNFDLQPSRSRHAELGLKTVLTRSLRLDAALFNIRTENEIVVDRNIGGRTTFRNAGETARQGFELGAQTLFRGPWQASVALTYLRAVFSEGFDSGGAPVPAGSLLPGVPRRQLYAGLMYRRAAWYARAEAEHRSRVPVDDENSQFADAYTIANLVGGLTQRSGRLKLTEFARIDNLFDRTYVGSVIVNEGNGRFYEPAPGRNFSIGLEASVEF